MAINAPVLNYAAAVPQIDLSRSLVGGIGDALQVKAAQAEIAAREAQTAAAQRAAERAALYQEAVQGYLANPTADGALQLMTLNPEGSDGIRKAWEGRQADVRMTDFRDTAEAMGLLRAGKPEAALALAQRRVDAEVKAGRDPSEEQAVVDMIRADPVQAFGVLQYTLASIMEAQKPGSFAEAMKTFGDEARAAELQPDIRRKGAAEATSAEVEAQYADEKARTDIADKRNAMANRDAMTSVARMNAETSRMNAIQNGILKPPSGYRFTADGNLQPIPGGPGARQRTALPTAKIEELSSQADQVQELLGLRNDFDPSFSGFGSRVGNFRGRFGIGSDAQERQSDWWQRMEAFDNVVRNKLFGASLTAGEQAAWERTTVTPNMAPDRIQKNLDQRAALLRSALTRRANAYKAGGYAVPVIDIAAAVNAGAASITSAADRAAKVNPRQQRLAKDYTGLELK